MMLQEVKILVDRANFDESILTVKVMVFTCLTYYCIPVSSK